ncbi:MAG: hypothetical protein LBV08_04285 [Clostridiales bacterium]|jgi:hypothetical protein|nr:hypothetical protein [Clostridiales bacterium]
MVKNYEEFCTELVKAGFSMASGGNSDGIFSLIEHGWNDTPIDSPIQWHTGDKDTDPWEWRIRVLDERNDIAYAKLFFKKAGYITKEWYPYFLAARRKNKGFEEEYSDGSISHYAKRIYDTVVKNEYLPLHEIKKAAGFGPEDKTKFDSALTELQMKLYLTICGRRQKAIRAGSEGWPSTVFCSVEKFFGDSVFEKAGLISANEAIDKITAQIYMLNPGAPKKKVEKFIKG